MLGPKQLARFLASLAVIYGLLLVPWPGWKEHYSAWVCGLARIAFASEHGRLWARFEPEPAGSGQVLDTRITLVNREQLAPGGTGPAQFLGLDARGVGWVPTALLIALIGSTPLPWWRRVRALAGGLIAIHAFLLLAIGIYVLNHADKDSGLSVVTFSPFVKTIMSGLEETFIIQMGPGFVVAVLIWILVSFRRDDVFSPGI